MGQDGVKGKKGQNLLSLLGSPKVRSRVRLNRAMDHEDHRKWPPNGIRAMVMVGS